MKDKELLLKDLCARLPYGVRGKVKADTVVPHEYDIDGFPLETTFDVDVELQRIDVSTDEIFVSTFDNNEDLGNYIEECQIEGIPWTIKEFTPYLRPLSSMTEEEAKDYINCKYSSIEVIELRRENGCNISTDIKLMWLNVFDFLNSHHFDYRGLIEKGLALVALEGMYKTD